MLLTRCCNRVHCSMLLWSLFFFCDKHAVLHWLVFCAPSHIISPVFRLPSSVFRLPPSFSNSGNHMLVYDLGGNGFNTKSNSMLDDGDGTSTSSTNMSCTADTCHSHREPRPQPQLGPRRVTIFTACSIETTNPSNTSSPSHLFEEVFYCRCRAMQQRDIVCYIIMCVNCVLESNPSK